MSEIEKSVIISYANNDMSVAKTARELSYHHTSICYYLRKIFEKYNLNPRRFYDLVKLVQIVKDGAE